MKRRVLSLAFYGAALALPCLIVLAVLYKQSFYPFGEKVLPIWDLQITYTYFYEWFRSVLEGEANIFYSFSKSLGGGMYSGWAGLLTNPINWFVAAFPKNPTDFTLFMLLVRFSLAGPTAYFYIRRRFKLSRPITLCLAVCYSMMLFMTTQSANPMWMDVVIMLPLVMYGLYCVVRKGKIVFFFVSLLLTIIFNYYNGYMVCLFSILFYLFESYLYAPQAARTRAKFMVNPGRFSAAFTCAVFASVFILLPTVIGLLAGKGAVPGGLFDFTFRYELSDVFRSFFIGVYEKEYLPQFYCGTFALIGALWFFLNGKIGKREKIAAGAFITFMIVCTWYAPFDRIWLGFRDGNSFYCRFAFLISALVIFFAARALETLDRATVKKLLLASGIVALVAFIIFADGRLGGRRYLLAAFAMCVVVPACLVLMDRYKKHTLIRCGLSLVLIAGVSFEAFLSCDQVFTFRYSGSKSTHDLYEKYYEQGRNAIAEIDMEDGSEANAYRVEKTYNFLSDSRVIALNETMAFRYAGVALYDSAYDDRTQNLLHRFGYTPDRSIRTSYNDPMIVADSLLGIRYVADDEAKYGYKDAGLQSVWAGRSFYENPFALPLGYKASPEIYTPIAFNGNPFDYQNDFVNALTGQESSCIKEVPTKLISKSDEEWVWEVDVSGEDYLYGYIEYPESPQRTVKDENAESLFPEQLSVDLCDGNDLLYIYIDDWSQGMFPIKLEKDGGSGKISIKGDALKDFDGDMNFYAASVDVKAFEETFEKLAEKPFDIETFEGGHVYGSYVADGDDVLFTTIPYDSGWAITVNGEQVEPQIVQDCFIALDLEQGSNVIEMTYTTPGLTAGIAVSVISVLLFVAFTIVVYKRPVRSKFVDKLTE